MPPKWNQTFMMRKVRAGHPYNQFLLEKFVALKRIADAQKLQNHSGCYRKIIISLSKYPVPIVSIQQANTLEGVGDKMAKLIKTLIDEKYHHFIEELNSNEFHQAAQQQTQQNTIVYQDTSEVDTVSLQVKQKEDQNSNSISLNNRIVRIGHSKTKSIRKQCNLKSIVVEDNSLDVDSKNKILKIKKQTPPYYFIKAFNRNTDITLSKNDIQTQIMKKYQVTIKTWTFIKKLQNQKYIQVLQSGYKLLPQGRDALPNQNKAVKSILYRNLMTQLQSRNYAIFKEQRSQKKSILKSLLGTYKLILIIDSREVKVQDFKEYFNKKLIVEQEIPCKHQSINLGDFIWVLETQKFGRLVLDYIIQRKISSDLVSSIIDGRYKEQRFRLSNSGISNVYYIYQGSFSATSLIPQRAVEKALRSIQFKSGFKVLRTTDIRHTIRYLIAMHQQIFNTIQESESITVVSTLKVFNLQNKKSNIPINCMFGKMLKCIPGFGKQTVELLVSKFKSVRDLYLSLRTLPIDERLHFMKTLIDKNKSGENAANILLKILFSS